MIAREDGRPLALVGCGILRKEVETIVRAHGWALEPHFLDSTLHNYLDKLSAELTHTLEAVEREGRVALVFYGACHPLMAPILRQHHAVRTHGQNCIAMLLGHDLFAAHLARGAYFLLEDWAHTFEPMITQCFGDRQAVVREIFKGSHALMIAVRTPCSGDFTAAAERAAAYVDLPLEWMDVGLEHLEAVLEESFARRRRGAEER